LFLVQYSDLFSALFSAPAPENIFKAKGVKYSACSILTISTTFRHTLNHPLLPWYTSLNLTTVNHNQSLMTAAVRWPAKRAEPFGLALISLLHFLYQGKKWKTPKPGSKPKTKKIHLHLRLLHV
jgi:hypothetical protein